MGTKNEMWIVLSNYIDYQIYLYSFTISQCRQISGIGAQVTGKIENEQIARILEEDRRNLASEGRLKQFKAALVLGRQPQLVTSDNLVQAVNDAVYVLNDEVQVFISFITLTKIYRTYQICNSVGREDIFILFL